MRIILKIAGGYGYYDEITFLKGFSIITIVLMHYLQNGSFPGLINTAFSIGGTGVHIFFLCSGFGLYISYMEKPLGFTEFIKNRLLKIYIPYIIIVGISALLPYMYEGNRLKAFLSHLFLYKMFIPEYEISFGVQFWYISTLFQFYLAFILLVKVKDRLGNPKAFLAIGMIVSIMWWIISAQTGIDEERIWGSFFLQYIWEFVLGMVVAEHLKKGNEIKVDKLALAIISVLGIGIAGTTKMIGGVLTAFNDVFAMFGYGALALFVYSLGIGYVNRLVMFSSMISYELYLIHILVYNTVRCFINSWFLTAVISLLVSFILALTYNRLINRVRTKTSAVLKK